MPIAHVCRSPSSPNVQAPEDQLPYTLTLKQVIELTNLSKAYIYELIARREFPQPAKVGRKSLWLGPEVEAWIKARFAERGPS